jgi:hypothetical protein
MQRFSPLLVVSLLAVGLVVFGLRLIPLPEGDRAICEAVADGLRAGQRLYAEVYDNKDPLFFYAVALQRLTGPWGGGIFELGSLALGGWCLAQLHRWLVSQRNPRREWLVGLLGALLLSGGFWGPGQPQLPASALTLLSLLLLCQGRCFAGGWAAGAVAGFKLICLPLPLAFALSWGTARSFWRFSGGLFLALLAGAATLAARGEMTAYGEALAKNVLYSQGLLVQPGSPLEVLASHGRTLFFSGKNNLLMLVALVTAAAICLQAIRAAAPRRQQLARAGLMMLLTGALITLITGLWAGHLQLLYPGQCLALLLVVSQWHPQPSWQRALRLPSLLLLTAFLSGTLDLSPTYWLKPGQIQAKLERIQQQSGEVLAIASTYPKGIESFARLGGNGGAIPVGWRGSSQLACPEFHQYGFYSQSRLSAILDCTSQAPVVLVSTSFSAWEGVPTWLPREAQGERISARWNDFVEAGEALLAQRFHCQMSSDGTRLCVNREVRR